MEELSLLQQGYFQLKQSKYSLAKEIFEQVNAEKENASAYIGILLAENGMQEEGQLVELPEELASYEAYRKAYALAGKGVMNQLDALEKQQREILDGKEEKYVALLKNMKNGYNDDSELNALISAAVELKDYKNSRELRESLEKELAAREEEKKKRSSKKKKILIPAIIAAAAVLLTALLLFCLPKRNGVRYALTFGGYVAISADRDLETVTLEKEINGIPVTEIGSKAFKDHEKLTKVVLHEKIETIGKSSFNGCVNLDSVVNAENVGNVKDKAFKKCKALSVLVFADECAISENAFRECDKKLAVFAGDDRQTIVTDKDEE